MTPVISPWLFYLMSIVNKVNLLFGICIIVSGVMLFFTLMEYDCEKTSFMKSEEKVNSLKRMIKKLVILMTTSAIALVFVPTQSTITKMIIAQNVTYERVEVVGDTVETVYNDIMALFEDKGETE